MSLLSTDILFVVACPLFLADSKFETGFGSSLLVVVPILVGSLHSFHGLSRS